MSRAKWSKVLTSLPSLLLLSSGLGCSAKLTTDVSKAPVTITAVSQVASVPVAAELPAAVTRTFEITTPSQDATITGASVKSVAIAGTCAQTGQEVSLTGDGVGAAVCDAKAWTTTVDLSKAPDGPVALVIKLAAIGRTPASQTTLKLTKAAERPLLAITSPVAGATLSLAQATAVVFTGTCSDTGSQVELRGAATATVPCTNQTWTATLDLSQAAPGPVTTTAATVDANGNSAVPATVIVVVQAPPPNAPSAPTAPALTEAGSVTFQWTAPLLIPGASSAQSYVLRVGTTPGGTDVFNGPVNGLSQTITGINGLTYYGQVQAVAASGAVSALSPSSSGTLVDGLAPVPGASGALLSSSSSHTVQIVLSWTAATDNLTASAQLTYQTYVSTANNIDTLEDVLQNGTPYGSPLTAVSLVMTNLLPGTQYWINVLVQDQAGNQAVYVAQSVLTSGFQGPVCFDREIYASASDGVTTYVGGDFTTMSRCTGSGVPIDLTSAAMAVPYAQLGQLDGNVNAVVADGNGGFFIGGTFQVAGSKTRHYLAQIGADGAATTWAPSLDGPVSALALSGTTLYVGGTFAHAGGAAHANLAAISTTSGLATAFNADTDGPVATLLNHGATLYVGGSFHHIGGSAFLCLAAVDGVTGVVSTWNPQVDGPVSTLALSGTTLYAGGGFTHLGGAFRTYLGSLDTVSAVAVATFNPAPNAAITAIALSGSTLYVAGAMFMTSLGGSSRNQLGALDATTGAVTSWYPYVSGVVLNTIYATPSAIYIGGQFNLVNSQPRRGLVAVDPVNGTTNLSFNPGIDGTVNAVALSGNTLYVGGAYSGIGGVPRHYLAAINNATGDGSSFNPGVSDPIDALALIGTNLYVGGFFSTLGGLACANLGAIDTGSWTKTAWSSGADDQVITMSTSGTTLYVGGYFQNLGGSARASGGAFNSSTGLLTAWSPTTDGVIEAIAASGAQVFIGGKFTQVGGNAHQNLAMVAATDGSVAAWAPDPSSDVLALTVASSTVFVGGNFTSAAATGRNYLASFTLGSTPALTGWNPNANGKVVGLATIGSNVYVGGRFTSIGGANRSYLGAVDATSGAAIGWDPEPNNFPYYLFGFGSTIYTAGYFSSVGGYGRTVGQLDATTAIPEW